MSKPKPTESVLESATGAASAHATEAFALLGNETRLAILLALWEEYDPHGAENAVPFSRIAERLEHDDPGNLRYHLEQLRGQFLRQEAPGEGYELRVPGRKLVRVVIAGAGVGETTLEPTEIDQPCLRCGASTTIRYRNGCLFWACTECEGPTPETTDVDGFLSATPFDPAGVADRPAEAVRLAALAKAWHKKRSMFDGFCPDCSGAVDGWLACCSDHDDAGVCDDCGTAFAAWARFECQVCKRHDISSPKLLALCHPAVVAFYDAHGESIRLRAGDFENARRVFEHMHAHEMELDSAASTRLRVIASLDGDEIRVTFDETATVVDVQR